MLHLPARELGHPAERGQVDVLRRDGEEVDGDLLAGAVQRKLLVEVRGGAEAGLVGR